LYALAASWLGVRCKVASRSGWISISTSRSVPPISSTAPTPGTRTSAGRTMRSATSRSRRASGVAVLAMLRFHVITGTEVGSTRSTIVVVPFGSST